MKIVLFSIQLNLKYSQNNSRINHEIIKVYSEFYSVSVDWVAIYLCVFLCLCIVILHRNNNLILWMYVHRQKCQYKVFSSIYEMWYICDIRFSLNAGDYCTFLEAERLESNLTFVNERYTFITPGVTFWGEIFYDGPFYSCCKIL